MSEPPNKRSKPSTPSDSAGPSTLLSGTLAAMENPYLAHLPPHMRGTSTNAAATGANGVNGTGKVSNPLNGLVPRRVTVDQAKTIMVSSVFSSVLKAGRRGQPIQKPRTLLPKLSKDSQPAEEPPGLSKNARVLHRVLAESDHGHGGTDGFGKDNADPAICMLFGSAYVKGEDGGVYATEEGRCHECCQASGRRDGR